MKKYVANKEFNMKKIIKKAFSLVELMVTLIVVSCLIAAMAPVITKKLKSNSITVGSSGNGGGGLSVNCSQFGSSCTLCEGGKCVSCVKSCNENQALNVDMCRCDECNSIHGANCLKCDMDNCSKCSDGTYLDNGACVGCDSGYYCDGTNSVICPKGYYCSDGAKTQCPIGTYNDSEGKTTISDCKSCNSKTPNCTTCDRTTGLCEACESGYDLISDSCATTEFLYTYTGNYSEVDSTSDGQKIKLTSNGTFTALNSASAMLYLVGGGGAGGYCGCGGGGGYITKTKINFIANTEYTVTIGKGGASSSGTGGSGGTTKLGTFSAAGATGGTKGYSCTGGAGGTKGGGYTCAVGINGTKIDGEYYGGSGASGCSQNAGGKAGGKGGGGNSGAAYANGTAADINTGGGGGGGGWWLSGQELICANSKGYGGTGGSGIVIILVD